ncbi:hypothetical protein ACFQV2_06995 [Actinokineospora soli]|uniref:Uncharacterized protein n=1 Tax=Actinokineospora soli TaxID=1048753 RepID=A0ABW2TI15_9PSEU
MITNLRLYVEPYALAAFRSATGLNPTREAGSQRVVDAVDEYKRVDEAAGMWGIGYRSVPAYFDATRADPASWYHLP